MQDATLPKDSAKVAHFCSMKISEDVRDYAVAQGLSEIDALKESMGVKAVEFVKGGAEAYCQV